MHEVELDCPAHSTAALCPRHEARLRVVAPHETVTMMRRPKRNGNRNRNHADGCCCFCWVIVVKNS